MANSTTQEIRDKIAKLKIELEKKDKAIEALRGGKGVKDQRVILEFDEDRVVKALQNHMDQFEGVVKERFSVFEDILRAIENVEIPEVKIPSEVKISNIPPHPPQLPFPREIRVSNFPSLPDPPSFKSLEVKLGEIKGAVSGIPQLELPKEATNPVPVRLSDGKKFYDAITQVFSPGGGGSVPTRSTSVDGIRGVAVVNPDGTNITGGRTLVSAGGLVSSSGNNTLVAAGTNKLKVYAFSLSTLATTAVTCIFQSGASGTELWRAVLQAPTSVGTGANLAVSPPAWLFATASATLLNLNLSGAQSVHWSASYFDEA